MPNPTAWARAAAALNLRSAMRVAQMGLKHKQLGGVLRAYFSGAEIPELASNLGRSGVMNALSAFQGAPGNVGVGAFRAAAAGAAGLAAVNIGSGNNAFAGVAAAGAYYGAYRGLGTIPQAASRPLARGAAGLMASSIAWQGLRAPRVADYTG